MSYKSPIELIMGQMNLSMEGEICKAIQHVGVNVDKEELLKALQYDRDQYQKGYSDRDAEIVRCKNCEHSKKYVEPHKDCWCNLYEGYKQPDWFCADGEQKET